MLRTGLFRVLGLATAALAAMGAGACGGSPDDETSVTSAIVTENALTANALTANALTANALTANALTANALRDPLGREVLKYIVSCALDENDKVSFKVDGVKYTFDGSLGLAPEWGDKNGSCDGSCQRWVSACVLARVDAAGVKRDISIRGPSWALLPDANELRTYTVREAAYYGNLFVEGQPRFLCLARGQHSDPRVCGDSLASCPMTVVGSCDDACVFEGLFGAYNVCSDAGKVRRGTMYNESITVFLPKSAM